MIHDIDLAFGSGQQEHDVILNIDGKEYSMRRLIETIDIIESRARVAESTALNMQQQLRTLQTSFDALSTQVQSMSQKLDRLRTAFY